MNDTYFDLQRQALDKAYEYAEGKGYEVIEPENFWVEHINYGTTGKYHLELRKDGKVQKKMLHISLYRMDNGKYELTQYIN
jgi:ureidoglycolate hydrolase